MMDVKRSMETQSNRGIYTVCRVLGVGSVVPPPVSVAPLSCPVICFFSHLYVRRYSFRELWKLLFKVYDTTIYIQAGKKIS